MSTLWNKAISLFRAFWRELAKFGVVGGVAFIIDSAIFLWLITGPMEESHVKARIIAGGVATLFSWVGNRYWTFRHQRSKARVRELLLFIVMNLIGMGIQAACVFVSFYGLGLTSAAASFVSGNIIGLGFAMCFRFVAYKFWVFTGDPDSTRAAAARSAATSGSTEDMHLIADTDVLHPVEGPQATASRPEAQRNHSQ